MDNSRQAMKREGGDTAVREVGEGEKEGKERRQERGGGVLRILQMYPQARAWEPKAYIVVVYGDEAPGTSG